MRHALSPACGSPLPPLLLTRLAAFADLFTRPTWSHVLWLVAGAALAPGRRTVTATLRILGREQESDFGIYHRILSRARWSARVVARQLLHLLVRTFLSADAPVVIGFDDTIERRWGHKIRARGIYRDPVRSSKGHFVKASGLRWLSAMLLAPVPWAGRVLALPFLTVLVPSERFYTAGPRAPKALLDWARQIALQIRRWLPGRSIVLVLDGAFAALEFLAAVRAHACIITRLRLDANLFAPAPPRRKGPGRPPLKGKRLPKLGQRLVDPATHWQPHTVALWYGRTNRRVEIATEPRSGITPACRPCRSAGSWCATRPASSIPTPSWPPISTSRRKTCCSGSSCAGRSRSRSRKPAPTSAWKPNANGPIAPSCAPPRRCSASSRSRPCGSMTCRPLAPSRREPPHGTANLTSPSATPSQRCAARSGAIRILARLGPAQRSSKFLDPSGTA
jgi:DDE superfamily endonuclease